jgi:hypothetical protein
LIGAARERTTPGGIPARNPAPHSPKVVQVDQATGAALQLAEDAIGYVHVKTPWGAPNQTTQTWHRRDGSPTRGEGITRTKEAGALAGLPGLPYDPPSLGLAAGGTLVFGAGMCGHLASLALAYAAHQGRPSALTDLTLKLVRTSFLDFSSPAEPNELEHMYGELSWSGCAEPVAMDPWPTRAQACLESDYFASAQAQRRLLRQHFSEAVLDLARIAEFLERPKQVLASITLDDRCDHLDVITQGFAAYRRWAPKSRTVPVPGVPPPSPALLERFRRCTGQPADRPSSIADDAGPLIQYRHGEDAVRRRPSAVGPLSPSHFLFGVAVL